MRRVDVPARPGWERTVLEQGLVFEPTVNEKTGQVTHYWNEHACYEFTLDEVYALEAVSENLHRMSLEAARFLAEEGLRDGSPWELGIPPEAVEYAAESLRRGDPSLYGRFDLVYGGPERPAKMLEYNADTPTGLVEAALIQWYWFEDTFQRQGYDQWNGLHEELVAQWGRVRRALGDPDMLHVGYTDADTSGEDLMTVTYVMDTAIQAGFEARLIEMKQVGHDESTDRFVAADNRFLEAFFKLYPWEDMMFEDFGRHLCRAKPAYWVEPAWKMLLSTKLLPAALWHLYPGHENLLATYTDSPRGMTEYVKKPLHGREGANIELHGEGLDIRQLGPWGAEGHVYQEYCALPNFPGPDGAPNRPVLGTWMIGDECYGVGIRESDGPITDYYCRFVPNRIAPES